MCIRRVGRVSDCMDAAALPARPNPCLRAAAYGFGFFGIGEVLLKAVALHTAVAAPPVMGRNGLKVPAVARSA